MRTQPAHGHCWYHATCNMNWASQHFRPLQATQVSMLEPSNGLILWKSFHLVLVVDWPQQTKDQPILSTRTVAEHVLPNQLQCEEHDCMIIWIGSAISQNPQQRRSDIIRPIQQDFFPLVDVDQLSRPNQPASYKLARCFVDGC